MIYVSDDIVQRYTETLACLLSQGNRERFDSPFVERAISYSRPFSEFENGNSRILAFSSQQEVYRQVYSDGSLEADGSEIYGMFGWMAEVYIHLALNYRPITFEFLFFALPIEDLSEKWRLYHEMDISQIDLVFEQIMRRSKLDTVMKRKGYTVARLSQETGIPAATIRSLRYGYRELGKAETMVTIKIASALDVKPQTLL